MLQGTINGEGQLSGNLNTGVVYNGVPMPYDLPTASANTLGGIKVGSNLKINNGVLSVDTANIVEQDNTKPVTSAAVNTQIGNIEVLLQHI